jgi:uncharacterized protein YqjF (DUF2071 family)
VARLAPDVTWEPPHRVTAPVMLQSWAHLALLHWAYDPDVIAARLPDGLEPDLFQGRAWVSITPFELTLRPPVGPPMTRAPETNLRTYVSHGPKSGIWFFSLDLGSMTAAGAARASYGLPYCWSDMTVDHRGNSFRYRSRRIWPADEAAHDIRIRVGKFVDRQSLGDLDRFLTARWRLFARRGPLLTQAPIEHPAFDFAQATVTRLEESLFAAARLPEPEDEPLVHYTPGVDVRVGAPRPA